MSVLYFDWMEKANLLLCNKDTKCKDKRRDSTTYFNTKATSKSTNSKKTKKPVDNKKGTKRNNPANREVQTAERKNSKQPGRNGTTSSQDPNKLAKKKAPPPSMDVAPNPQVRKAKATKPGVHVRSRS